MVPIVSSKTLSIVSLYIIEIHWFIWQCTLPGVYCKVFFSSNCAEIYFERAEKLYQNLSMNSKLGNVISYFLKYFLVKFLQFNAVKPC